LAPALLIAAAGNAMSNLIKNVLIEKSGIPLLEKYLNLSSIKHKLIAGNIANVATPKYQSRDIDFHGELRKAMSGGKHIQVKLTDPKHIPLGKGRDDGPEIIVNKSKDGNGINNVDIDKEVANLAKNQIYYSVGAQLMAKKISGIKNVIRSK